MSDEKSGQETRPSAWWYKYIDEHSGRSDAVIRGKGISVWSLIGYYRLYRGDGEQLLASWLGRLTAEELEAALAYYWANPHQIDERLEEISGESAGIYVGAECEDTPLPQNGEPAWRKYIDEESRSVALIRDKGWSVWSLVRYYRIHRGDNTRVMAAYHGELTAEELDAALSYYWANWFLIDERLKALSA